MTPELQKTIQPKSAKTPLNLALLAVLLGVLLGLAIYAKSFGNGLTNWDDSIFLEDLPIRKLDLAGIFSRTLLSNYYPLTLLSISLDYRLGGGSPFAFHLTSFLLHLLNSGLAGVFTFQLFQGRRLPALLAGAIFLTHPVQVEAVSWLAARNYPLSTAFLLSSLLFYRRDLETQAGARATSLKKRPSYWIAWVLFIMALLSKSHAVILPLLFLVMDFIPDLNPAGLRTRKLLEKIPYLIPAIPIALVTIQGYSTPGAGAPEIFGLSLAARALWALKGIAFYLHQFFMPLRLSAYYDLQLVEFGFLNWIPALVFSILLFLYWKTPRLRSAAATFGLTFFLVGLLPSLKLIPFGEYSIFNDRYLYAPMLGLLLFSIGVVSRLKTRNLVAAAILAPMLLTLSWLSFERTLSWKDAETLWKDILKTYPATAMAHNNLGRVYLERGEWEPAREEFLRATASRPGFDKPHYNLGLVEDHFNRPEQAALHYRKALEINPGYPEAHNNLGNFHSRRSEHRQALEHYLKGIQAGARFKEIYFNAAWTFLRTGNSSECRRYLDHVLRLDPGFAPALHLARQLPL